MRGNISELILRVQWRRGASVNVTPIYLITWNLSCLVEYGTYKSVAFYISEFVTSTLNSIRIAGSSYILHYSQTSFFNTIFTMGWFGRLNNEP